MPVRNVTFRQQLENVVSRALGGAAAEDEAAVLDRLVALPSQFGAGAPGPGDGDVTPGGIGWVYVDTLGGIYVAVGATSADWELILPSDAEGAIRYDFDNDGDWLDIAVTGKNPDTGFPMRFDVGVGDDNVGTYVSPATIPLGGLAVQALNPAGSNTYVGISLDLSGDDSSTIDGYTLRLIAGGTVTGYHDYIESPGASAAYSRRTKMVDTGGSSHVSANELVVTAGDGVSAYLLEGSVTAGESSDVAVIQAGAQSTGDSSNVYGVDVGASAAGASSTAYGVRARATTADGAQGYSGWFEGGDFVVKLPVGATFTILNHNEIPIFQVDEDGDLHGLTGKALTFDL